MTKKIIVIVSIFVIAISFNSFSQTNDAVRMIFSAKTFSVTEKYVGTSGEYVYKYSFTKGDDSVNIIWEEIKNDNRIIKEKKSVTYKELKTIEKFFSDCVSKIKNNKSTNGSTELSIYTFRDESLTYEIDDDKSMICVEDIKSWRSKMFPNSIK